MQMQGMNKSHQRSEVRAYPSKDFGRRRRALALAHRPLSRSGAWLAQSDPEGRGPDFHEEGGPHLGKGGPGGRIADVCWELLKRGRARGG